MHPDYRFPVPGPAHSGRPCFEKCVTEEIDGAGHADPSIVPRLHRHTGVSPHQSTAVHADSAPHSVHVSERVT